MSALTVLIVDDSHEDCNTLREYLTEVEENRYAVVSVPTGGDALRILAEGDTPACILLNDVLPDMDGLNALESLVNRGSHCPPVVMLSKTGSPALAVRAMKGGAEDYLLKEDLTPEVLRSTVIDAIEKEALQRALHESRAQFEAAFTDSGFGMALMAPDGRWLKVNPALTALLGYSEAELLSTTSQALTHPDDLDPCLELMQQALAGGLRNFQTEKRYVRKDGTTVWTVLSNSLVRGPQGMPLYFVAQFKDISERKKAQIALQLSEERLRLAMKGGGIGAFDWNIQTGAIEWSGEIEEFMGMAPGTFERSLEGFEKLVHPDDLNRVKQHLAEAISGSGAYKCEFRMVRADGGIRWVIGKGSVFYDEVGQPIRMVGVDFEITERKRIEEELRVSEERLRLGIQLVGLGLANIDYTTGLNQLSAEAAQLFGLGETAIVVPRATVHATFHPADVPELTRRIAASLDPKGPGWFKMDHRIVWPSGEMRWLRVHKHVLFEGEGDDRHAVSATLAALDVTAEKTASETLRQSEERLRLCLSAASAGSWDWEVRTGTIVWSPENYALYDIDPTEELSDYIDWEASIHPDDRAAASQAVQAALSGDVPEFKHEFRIVTRRGEVRWILGLGRVEWDGDGTAVRMSGINLDINERYLHQQQIAELNARLQRSVAESHHRIKNNLQMLSAMVDVQMADNNIVLSIEEFRRIGQHIRTLAALHDLLTLDAKHATDLDTVSLRAALEKLVPLLQNTQGKRHISLQAEEIVVTLKQASSFVVLVNELVSNALKHGRGTAEVTLAQVGTENPVARLEVCDDGPGFPADFNVVHAANTGLELIESLGRWDLRGDVRYENRPEGGARVVVTFPLQAAD